MGALPDPHWPVSQQLEHAVTTIKRNVKLVMDSKAEAAVFKQVSETKLKYIFFFSTILIVFFCSYHIEQVNSTIIGIIKRKLFVVPILEYLTASILSTLIWCVIK